MNQDIINIFKSAVLLQGDNKQIGYCFFCSFNYFVYLVEHEPLKFDCKGEKISLNCKKWQNQSLIITHLNKHSFEEILMYLNYLIKGKLSNHRLNPEAERLLINQLKSKLNLKYNKSRKFPLYIDEFPFKKTNIEIEVDGIKPHQLPFLNSQDLKNAKFFASLYFLFYHIEVGIRNYLRRRLKAVLGLNWQIDLKNSQLFTRAFTLADEVNLKTNYPKRGNDILNYCSWKDYPHIINIDTRIWDIESLDKNEFNAHISSMYKIRNAIAHNAETIDNNTIKEMEVFLIKYNANLK